MAKITKQKMNKQDKRINRKEVRYQIANSFINCLKCTSGESSTHRLTKYHLADFCWEHNIEFSTESVFRSGGRADFVIHDFKLIIEVLDSEKLSEFDKKQYPFFKIPVPATISIPHVRDFLQELVTTNGEAKEFYAKKFREVLK